MAITQGNIRDRLLAGDAEFQDLAREHHQYAEQLKQLTDSPYRSAEDLLLEAKLKKMKLRVKDEMERRLAHWGRADEVH